jgi:uncharacterized membrane protein YfcA
MSPVAWLGAFWIGIILGLFGSGGSIVTVPLLVYVVHQTEKVAIAGSLGIVGSIALVGGAVAAVRKRVHWRSVMFFGPAGMVGTYGGVWLASFVSGGVQLLVFAGVMGLAALFMLRVPPVQAAPSQPREQPVATLACQGLAVGSLTGFVGVGGGFLIVPALSLLGGLPMHVAVGTSLVVITLTSVVGFVRHLEVLGRAGMSVDWTIIAAFASAGVAGSLAGQIAGGRIPQARLKRMFAIFLLVAGAYITYRTLPAVLHD